MASTCDVALTIEDAGGTAVEGAVVRARCVTPQGTESGTIIAGRGWVSATTDENGLATLTLQQNAKCRIVCDVAGLDWVFEVPGQAAYNFAKALQGTTNNDAS